MRLEHCVQPLYSGLTPPGSRAEKSSSGVSTTPTDVRAVGYPGDMEIHSRELIHQRLEIAPIGHKCCYGYA